MCRTETHISIISVDICLKTNNHSNVKDTRYNGKYCSVTPVKLQTLCLIQFRARFGVRCIEKREAQIKHYLRFTSYHYACNPI